MQSSEDLADHIQATLGDAVRAVGNSALGDFEIQTDVDGLRRVLTFLRDDSLCLFKQLMDIAGVDRPERAERFEIVYHLLSPGHNQRVRVRLSVGEGQAVPSATAIFPSAGWYEREVWDMFGVAFSGHDDLRRLLTDYGFEGHPLRKEFPLTGFVECRYDEEEKRVVQEPVRLVQDFRNFDFLSPWEGMLPGDNKAREG